MKIIAIADVTNDAQREKLISFITELGGEVVENETVPKSKAKKAPKEDDDEEPKKEKKAGKKAEKSVKESSVTLDDLRELIDEVSEDHREEIVEELATYKVKRLSDLPEKHYSAFADFLNGLKETSSTNDDATIKMLVKGFASLNKPQRIKFTKELEDYGVEDINDLEPDELDQSDINALYAFMQKLNDGK